MLTPESPVEVADETRGAANIPRGPRWAALLAVSPLDRAVAAIAIALLGGWLVTRLTTIPFAPEGMAEWIMARTPADAANLLLDGLGVLARPTAVLGGFACYLLLAFASGLLDAALVRWGRALGSPAITSVLPLVTLAGVWGLAARVLGQPWQPNALALALFVSAWLAIGVARPSVPQGERRSRRSVLQAMALGSGAVLISANVVLAHALAQAVRGVKLGGELLFT